MASETDPLLPNNEPAPEIVGYGFSRAWKKDEHDQSHTYSSAEIADDSEVEQSQVQSDADLSPMRTVIMVFIIVVAFALAISSMITGMHGSREQAPRVGPPKRGATVEARVEKILTENPLIDGHIDLAGLIRYVYRNNIYDSNFTEPFEQGGVPLHVDLPRLEKGKIGGAFWSAWVGCPTNGSDFSDKNYAGAVSKTLSQLDLLQRLTERYPHVFSSAVVNSSKAVAAFEKQHLLISPFAIEGLHQIGNSFANLRLYDSLNVKYATLTHNCHNKFADAALITDGDGQTIKAPPLWGGVSKDGQVVVREMNRLGMLVDLSHVSENTMLDVLGGRKEKWEGSAAPVIFSHSSAYALCPHPRNVPDEALDLVKKTNSLVMVNVAPEFISCVPSNSSTGVPDFYPTNSTLHQVARHVMYIGNKIGFDHVGFGSDFDGIFDTPRGFEDVSKYPDLIAELLRMGLTDHDAAKVVGRNLLRVWANVDAVARRMQSEGALPAEDTIQGF